MVSTAQNVHSPDASVKIQNHSLACKTQSDPWHFSVSSTPFFLVIGFQHKSSCYPSTPSPKLQLPHSQLRDFAVAVPLHGKLLPQILIWFPPLFYSGLSWNIALWEESSLTTQSLLAHIHHFLFLYPALIFITTWHYIIYFNLLHCLCLQL